MKKEEEKISVESQISKKTQIDEFLKRNINDYAIEVCQDRALVDYRDGLKPAQRRILQSMVDLKATWNKPTLKCARIAGDVMKNHPHGDTYGSLVTLVNTEYPIIYGQGNFGSLTDSAAASRYTEAKISEFGMKMLDCYPTIETVPNYTGEFQEPIVFTTRIPNFFINGSNGIAVGLSCNIPSHNLKEIVEAFKVVIKKGNSVKTKDIMKYIKGPDYQYGGRIISSSSEIEEMYEKGKGSIKFECEYKLEELKNKTILTVTSYCIGFNPTTFISKMISLIDEGIVLYVNDSSSKDDPYKLEVILKNKDYFYTHIEKYLIKSETYIFYALERNKSESIEKDIDIEVLTPNMVDLMIMWIDWRRDVETKMISIDLVNTELSKFRTELKLHASQHIDIIMKALNQDQILPSEYLVEKLPMLIKLAKTDKEKALDGAEYLGDQKIFSLRKLDQPKLEKDIIEYENYIIQLNNDLSNIDEVIIRYLNELKPWFKERKVKVNETDENKPLIIENKIKIDKLIKKEIKHEVVKKHGLKAMMKK